jgi:hypothetical protein
MPSPNPSSGETLTCHEKILIALKSVTCKYYLMSGVSFCKPCTYTENHYWPSHIAKHEKCTETVWLGMCIE